MIRNIILNFISFSVWYMIFGLFMPMFFMCAPVANMVGTFLAFLMWNIPHSIREKRFAWRAWGYLPRKYIKEVVHYQNTGERL